MAEISSIIFSSFGTEDRMLWGDILSFEPNHSNDPVFHISHFRSSNLDLNNPSSDALHFSPHRHGIQTEWKIFYNRISDDIVTQSINGILDYIRHEDDVPDIDRLLDNVTLALTVCASIFPEPDLLDIEAEESTVVIRWDNSDKNRSLAMRITSSSEVFLAMIDGLEVKEPNTLQLSETHAFAKSLTLATFG